VRRGGAVLAEARDVAQLPQKRAVSVLSEWHFGQFISLRPHRQLATEYRPHRGKSIGDSSYVLRRITHIQAVNQHGKVGWGMMGLDWAVPNALTVLNCAQRMPRMV